MDFTHLDDGQLLELAATGTAAGFRELVRRHAQMVYAAALRQTHRADIAEDVTQIVFVALLTKGPSLTHYRTVGGWLIRATRFAAIDAVRDQSRRRRHELAAAKGEQSMSDTTPDTSVLLGVLDSAMLSMRPKDRDVLVLRFFENHSAADIGQRLQLSEAAAQKRVTRALDALRGLIARSGVMLPAVAIGSKIAAESKAPAAPGFVVIAAANASARHWTAATAILHRMARRWPKTLGKSAVAATFLIIFAASVYAATQDQSAAESCDKERHHMQPLHARRAPWWPSDLAMLGRP